MDVFPKFIIEDGCLILSKCTYHHELVKDKTKVCGGGWFRYDSKTRTFTFHGNSHDFGTATEEAIQECINKDQVFTDKYQKRRITGKHHFAYDIGSEVIPFENPHYTPNSTPVE